MAVRGELVQQIESISRELKTEELRTLLDFATFLRAREEWAATRELLADPGMRSDVEEGRAQAAGGEGRPWREIRVR